MKPADHSFLLSCESTADLSWAEMKKRNIPFACYTYVAEGQEYTDTMGKDPEEQDRFYDLLHRGVRPVTSRLNPDEYLRYFESLPGKEDILHITLGTGMTGSYQCALMAAEEYRSLHPERRIEVADSVCSSAGYGLLVTLIADLRDLGTDIEKALEEMQSLKLRIQHRFFCTDLAYHRRSGRVSGLSAAVGTLLGICPMMCLNLAGEIVMFGKCRGTRKAARKTAEDVLRLAENGENYTGPCFINHSRCPEYAEMLKNEIVRLIPALEGQIRIFDIGPVIASHCGPDNCTVYFIGSAPRTEDPVSDHLLSGRIL